MRSPNWTKKELLLAIKLYTELPFGKLHGRNPEIIALAKLLGRTPGSVGMKLGNLASLDESILQKGLGNASELDEEMWKTYLSDREGFIYEAAKLLARYRRLTVERLYDIPEDELPKKGIERERIVMTRVNQSAFRSGILASYDNRCAITGIDRPELLIASHIVPWSEDNENRLNLRNGLCLNALHDRAFNAGLITVTPHFIVRVSKVLIRKPSKAVAEYILSRVVRRSPFQESSCRKRSFWSTTTMLCFKAEL